MSHHFIPQQKVQSVSRRSRVKAMFTLCVFMQLKKKNPRYEHLISKFKWQYISKHVRATISAYKCHVRPSKWRNVEHLHLQLVNLTGSVLLKIVHNHNLLVPISKKHSKVVFPTQKSGLSHFFRIPFNASLPKLQEKKLMLKTV